MFTPKEKFLLFAIMSLLPLQSVHAVFTIGQQSELTSGVATQAGVSTNQDVPTIVGNIARGLFAVLGLFFFIMVFYGGFRWITARGNEEQVAKAQKTVSAAFIGLIIVLASYAITAFLERIV